MAGSMNCKNYTCFRVHESNILLLPVLPVAAISRQLTPSSVLIEHGVSAPTLRGWTQLVVWRLVLFTQLLPRAMQLRARSGMGQLAE